MPLPTPLFRPWRRPRYGPCWTPQHHRHPPWICRGGRGHGARRPRAWGIVRDTVATRGPAETNATPRHPGRRSAGLGTVNRMGEKHRPAAAVHLASTVPLCLGLSFLSCQATSDVTISPETACLTKMEPGTVPPRLAFLLALPLLTLPIVSWSALPQRHLPCAPLSATITLALSRPESVPSPGPLLCQQPPPLSPHPRAHSICPHLPLHAQDLACSPGLTPAPAPRPSASLGPACLEKSC